MPSADTVPTGHGRQPLSSHGRLLWKAREAQQVTEEPGHGYPQDSPCRCLSRILTLQLGMHMQVLHLHFSAGLSSAESCKAAPVGCMAQVFPLPRHALTISLPNLSVPRDRVACAYLQGSSAQGLGGRKGLFGWGGGGQLRCSRYSRVPSLNPRNKV